MTVSGVPAVPEGGVRPDVAYEHVSAECDAAYMSGDRDRINATCRVLHEAGERLGQWNARRFAPSFEDLLRDPATQVDPEGAVLASVLAYQDALPASACACRGSLHRVCGGAS